MPNIKISAAADAGTLLSSDMLPLARSGDTNAYHATMTEIATFTNASVSSGAYNNTGRNLVHNPVFTVQQRGTGPWTASAVGTADRWYLSVTNDTVSVSIQPLADADKAAIGDENATACLQSVFTGSATAGSLNVIQQRMEGVRRFSGKTLTMSFWAKASSGTPRLGVSVTQSFGAGGSPSLTVWTPFGTTPALSTTWTRYVLSGTMPSAAGKTFGTTAGTDFSGLSICLSDQANISGTGIGVQSGTVQLWGVQLEYGSVATPLAKRDPADELALCQRFYCIGAIRVAGYSGAASVVTGLVQSFPVSMRAIPTLTPSWSVQANCTGTITTEGDGNGMYAYATATAAGQVSAQGTYTASADL